MFIFILSRCFTLPTVREHSALRDRVYRSSCTQVEPRSGSVNEATCNRPTKYRLWDGMRMREAINSVAYEGWSVRKAAEFHGIPKTTLDDHVNGRSLPGAKSGPPTLLSSEEEDDLVSFLIKSSEIGFSRTRKDVLAMVDRVLASKGIYRCVTSGWWAKFCKRHPEIVLRVPATVSTARARDSSLEAINSYFDVLSETYDQYDLADQPAVVFNMDESGFPLDPKPLKSVYARGSKNPTLLSSGQKSQVTVVACVSAAGQCLPPMVIWDRQTLQPDLAKGEVPGMVYGLSKKGWMNSELFHKWFKRHFLRYAPAVRPLILLMDGHSSHYCLETIELAAEEEVILFTLPPNTTHLTQPLDKGVFGPFKQYWRQVCHDYLISHPGKVVNRYNFSSLFSKAWMQTMSCSNIISGFRTTGIFPLDRSAVTRKVGKSESKVFEKLHYVPLFTPAKRKVLESSPSYQSDSDSELLESPCVSTSNYQACQRQHSLLNVADLRTPEYKPKRVKDDDLGRVITSAENIKLLNEKKKKKEDAIAKKSLRKEQREQKRQKKACKFLETL